MAGVTLDSLKVANTYYIFGYPQRSALISVTVCGYKIGPPEHQVNESLPVDT